MQGGNYAGQSMEPDAFSNAGRPSARWFGVDDLPASGLLAPRGVVIGKLPNGDLLRFNGDGHLMVFAPTGAGKGVSFVQPNLADYEGSCVVLDPKGENAIVSAELRRSMGQDIIILDPFGKTGFPSSAYNPLGALTFANNQTLGPMIEAIADAIIPTGEHRENPHWPLGAKKFAAFVMWYMIAHEPPERRNLVTLFHLAHSGYDNLYRMAGAMAAGLHPDSYVRGMCLALGNWLRGRESREFGYFESQLINNVSWVGDDVWQELLSAPPSEPLNLKADRPTTVYLVLPFNRIDRYRPWLRVMVADLLNGLYERGGQPELPVLFMLDEAYSALGGMEILYNAAGAVRAAGARLCFVYQDLPQVQKLYGKDWASLIANSGVTLFWGVNDLEAAQLVSNFAGYRIVPVAGNPAGVKEPLISPEEVLRMENGVTLALLKNSPPARFRRPHVEDDRYKNRLAENTTRNGDAGGDADRAAPIARAWVPVTLADYPLPDGSQTAAAAVADEAATGLLADLAAQIGHEILRDAAGEFYWLDERGLKVPLRVL